MTESKKENTQQHAVLLSGSSGKMGNKIKELIKKHPDFFLHGELSSSKDITNFQGADVVIDFSHQKFFPFVLEQSLKYQKPFVSGTTGLLDSDFQLLQRASQTIPVFWAPNMSFGVHQLKQVLKNFNTQQSRGSQQAFKIKIKETHHQSKKDKPSGTAIDLQQTFVTEQRGALPDIESFRVGEEFGTHEVIFENASERLSFKHEALSRDLFAISSLHIAQWLLAQPSGYYGMDEFINS